MALKEETDEAKLDRAGMLVMTLEKPVLAKVLKHLGPEELAHLMAKCEHLIKSGPPPEAQLIAVWETFLQSKGGDATSHFKDALVLALGEDGAESIMDQEHWRMIAERIKPAALGAFLREERPQAVAITLAQLPARYSAEVLSTLPEELRAEAVDHLARGVSAPAAALTAIRRAIEQNLSGADSGQRDQGAGARQTAAILNHFDSETASAVVEKIRADDPARAAAIEQEMFHFEDFMKLENRTLQAVLSEVKAEQLARALKGTSEEQRGAIMEALPDQVKAIVLQEIEESGKVPERDVRDARYEILELAAEMERSGKIQLRAGRDA